MGMNPAVDNFTAIINPPQSTILAIGTTQKVAVPVENEDGTTGFEWDEQLKVTGSFDHKVVDGAIGAEWLKEFKKVLENPLQLLLALRKSSPSVFPCTLARASTPPHKKLKA
ncbi:Dihydrolipoyllysine-residue acetyltransferase component of pyruvate like protein [Verticillium longisporum]|nr:Dihydrolipoyllysine-residue acetyltransferase component of pyruvate like protein [Verticillium longisporum]